MAEQELRPPQWRYPYPPQPFDPAPWPPWWDPMPWRVQRIPFPPGPGPGDPVGPLDRLGIAGLMQRGLLDSVEESDIIELQQEQLKAARTHLEVWLNSARTQAEAQFQYIERQTAILAKYAQKR